jgi:outer membrane assembly lipoprotein YfiO
MIPYAMYMIGMCHFEMLGDEMRDQASGIRAGSIFTNLIERFPQSPYVVDATQKIKIIIRYAAKQNIYIAETLMEEKSYASAINRLQLALQHDSELSGAEKQQVRSMLNTCYAALKLNHLITDTVKLSPTQP